MASDTVRKHFILPRELAEEFERVAGGRKQSETLAELVEQWLKRQRLLNVVDTFAGFVSAEDHPEWATSEDINAWVRQLRAEWHDPWQVNSSEPDTAATGG